MKIIDYIGDADPIEYAGGAVIKSDDGDISVEYTHGLDWEGADKKAMPVYNVPVSEDVFAEHDWVDLKDVVSFISSTPKELRDLGRSSHIMGRVAATEAIASYHGWDNLDEYPMTMTSRELTKRWKL